MFTANDIRARIKIQPFQPVRIVTSSGQTYDVFHPDMVLIAQRELIVGRASPRDPDIAEQTDRVSVLHITALEDLPTNSKPRRKRSA
ncbi:MAG: hypothetical protein HZA46_24210 [Planctomycetales bacterium]|nr:hypothetical protein [Planctomycetales bacterium]